MPPAPQNGQKWPHRALRGLGALKGPRALWGPYLPFKGYGVGSVAWAKPVNSPRQLTAAGYRRVRLKQITAARSVLDLC